MKIALAILIYLLAGVVFAIRTKPTIRNAATDSEVPTWVTYGIATVAWLPLSVVMIVPYVYHSINKPEIK